MLQKGKKEQMDGAGQPFKGSILKYFSPADYACPLPLLYMEQLETIHQETLPNSQNSWIQVWIYIPLVYNAQMKKS